MRYKVKLFVEGGNGNGRLKTEFGRFLHRAGVNMQFVDVIEGGTDTQTYGAFKKECSVYNAYTYPLLLIDSHERVNQDCQQNEDYNSWKPWEHFQSLKKYKNMERPQNTEDLQCHLMVQCFETWLFADYSKLETHFNVELNSEDKNRFQKNLETLACPLHNLRTIANKYTTTNVKYDKIDDGLTIFSKIDPKKVMEKSPWAKRFIENLERTANELRVKWNAEA